MRTVTFTLLLVLVTATATAQPAPPAAPAATAPAGPTLVERARRVAAEVAKGMAAAAVPLEGYESYRNAPRERCHVERFEEVTVETADGVRLPAWLVPPRKGLVKGKPKGTVLVLHGFGSDIAFALEQTEFLLDRGYQLFLLSARANAYAGRADEYDAWLKEDLDDVGRALEWLKARPDVDPTRIALYGFSWGGLKSVLAGARYADFRAVIDDAGPLPRAPLHKRYAEHMPPDARREPLLRAEFDAALDAATTERFGYALSDPALDPIAQAPRIAPRPLLVIQGTDDDIVDPASSKQIFAAAGEPKQLLLKRGFGHCLGMRNSPKVYVPAVVKFLDRAMK